MKQLPDFDFESDCFQISYLTSLPVSSETVRIKSLKDKTLKQIKEYIIAGWPSSDMDISLTPYFKRKNELTTFEGCIIFGTRIVIPSKLLKMILKKLHWSHLGIQKLNPLCRLYMW